MTPDTTVDLSNGNGGGNHPRMRLGPAIAVYVWQYALRLAHWGIVLQSARFRSPVTTSTIRSLSVRYSTRS